MTAPSAPRILISYFFGPDTIPLGASCAGGLRDLGWEVCCFNSQAESAVNNRFLKPVSRLVRGLGFKGADLARNTRWANNVFRQKKLEEAVAAFRPDVLLVIRGNSFEAEAIRRMKDRYGIRKTVGWWVKDPRDTPEMREDAKAYDHYFCIHRFGYGPEDNIDHLTALAVDNHLYRPLPGADRSAHEAVFVGGWSPRREQLLGGLADLPLEIYGPGWRKPGRTHARALRGKVAASRIWGEDLNRLYNSSKIVLNISSWDPQRTGLNLRIFDVPATGAFLLTDDTEDLDQYFERGVEIETFSTAGELREKVIHYLAHADEREGIARRGRDRAAAFETYTDKMKRLLEAIGEL